MDGGRPKEDLYFILSVTRSVDLVSSGRGLLPAPTPFGVLSDPLPRRLPRRQERLGTHFGKDTGYGGGGRDWSTRGLGVVLYHFTLPLRGKEGKVPPREVVTRLCGDKIGGVNGREKGTGGKEFIYCNGRRS